MRSSWVCVDASLAVRLVADPRDARVRDLWEEWDGEKRLLCAPSLLYFEVTNALYYYQRAHMMSASSMRLALTAALSLPIQLYGEASLHSIAIDLAGRFSLPAVYDAHYLALALVYGIDDPELPPHRGMGAVLVPGGADGVAFPRLYTFRGPRVIPRGLSIPMRTMMKMAFISRFFKENHSTHTSSGPGGWCF